MEASGMGIFDKKDHLHQRIARKDHLQKKMPKKTTFLWRQGVPSDTWHLPPLIMAARPAATVPGGTLGSWPGPLAGVEAVGHAAIAVGGKTAWCHGHPERSCF
jgi:hypothetical protein